jgi:phosphatidate phosphatase PAH1
MLTLRVHERRHEDFKTRVLLELQQVLRGHGSGSGKVIAGFGNHDTDVSAYSACGIDKAMIFIIDKSSRITLPLVGMPGGGSPPHFSGYLGLARHVNVIFPRVRSSTFPTSQAPLPPPAGAQKGGGGGGGGGQRERDVRCVPVTLIDLCLLQIC